MWQKLCMWERSHITYRAKDGRVPNDLNGFKYNKLNFGILLSVLTLHFQNLALSFADKFAFKLLLK